MAVSPVDTVSMGGESVAVYHPLTGVVDKWPQFDIYNTRSGW